MIGRRRRLGYGLSIAVVIVTAGACSLEAFDEPWISVAVSAPAVAPEAPAVEPIAEATLSRTAGGRGPEGAVEKAAEGTESEDKGFSAVASWYGPGFAGRETASGETFVPEALTAAHRELPFGTLLEVTNPRTGLKVPVRVNDRGPFVAGRQLDLSAAAFARIANPAEGVIIVWVRLIDTFPMVHYNLFRDERESGLKLASRAREEPSAAGSGSPGRGRVHP